MQPKIRKWRKNYETASYICECLKQLKPPEDITVSQWAQKYRLLDSKTSALPGPWRNDKTPYLMGIMDELNNYETEEIVFCKCAQLGGTEAELNMLGYVIQQDPAPAMVVYPSDKLGESVSDNRIKPMIKSAPTLRERFFELRSQKMEMQFDGMYLTISGANSPSNLASRAIKYLFLDEVDKYPGASKKEADPISLAKERTKTFANRKIYMTSTPTIKSGAIWKNLQDCDIEKHYFVPCPHCGEMIELKFANLRFPNEDGMTASDRADQAVYVCQECGCIITDQHKAKMLRFGEWRIVRESTAARRKIGYWISVLYSPFVRFSEVALEWLNAQGDPERLQNFKNSWLAEPWEDMKLTTSADIVMERQTEREAFVVPAWAKFITGGVDVQESSIYWSIRAWGDFLTSQNICHGQATSWADIERVMNYAYPKENSQEQLVVSLCLIDSGFDTDAVYDFCANNSDWALPSKGSSRTMDAHFHLSKINKTDSRAYGMNLAIVDGGKYKDMIAARMKKENGRGAWMVYAGCDMDYANQVTAEHKVQVKVGPRLVQKWELKSSHADNHYLDCEVYALAAADILGVRSMHLLTENQNEPQKRIDNTPVSQEESWIHANDGWI